METDVCVAEVSRITAKMEELKGSSVQCIAEHPGFATPCLDVWVLQTAYYQYRQHHGVSGVHTSWILQE